jgi:hypothetical protein
MVERFTTEPLELPPAEQPFTRADLLIYGVSRLVESYEGRIFFNAPRVAKTADHTHSELPSERDTFDLRLPHHLEPGVEIVTVTEKIRELLASGVTAAPVSVIGTVFSTGEPGQVLAFERIRLATYA